jgi:hypothetical protein
MFFIVNDKYLLNVCMMKIILDKSTKNYKMQTEGFPEQAVSY